MLEADFAEGDFLYGGFLDRGLWEVMVDVTDEAVGDLLGGFGVVVKGDIVGAEAVFESVQRGFRLALRRLGAGAVLRVAEIGIAFFGSTFRDSFAGRFLEAEMRVTGGRGGRACAESVILLESMEK